MYKGLGNQPLFLEKYAMGKPNFQHFACLAALVAMSPAAAQDMATELKRGQWRIDAEQTRFSAVLDGRLLDDEKSVVRDGTDLVDSWARSEWRVSWRPESAPWDLQWGAFVDTQVHVDGEGARAAARINNQVVGAPGTRYPFELESVKVRRLGVSTARGIESSAGGLLPARWTVVGSVFAVDQFKSANARGVLEDRTGANLALQANVVENELGKQSTFIRPEKILGWGLAVDVSAVWGELDANFLRLSVEDLGPSVRLSQVLGTDRTINTDTVSFDEEGYVQFAPAINGLYVNRRTSVRIKPEIRMEAGWQQRPGQRWLGSLIKHGARQEAALVYQQALSGYRLDVGAHALANMPGSISVGLFAPRWGVSWRGDSVRPSKARIWGLAGHFAY